MKIVVLHNRDINDFPPTQYLVKILEALNFEVSLITFDRNDYCKTFSKKTTVYKLKYDKNNSRVKKGIDYLANRKTIHSLLDRLSNDHTVIWTTTDSSVAAAKEDLFKFKHHIMQLMELVFDWPAYPKQKLIMTGLSKYAQRASYVVVPEYNRAKILEACWNLCKTPIVLPNKTELAVNTDYSNSEFQEVFNIIRTIKESGKKIVLYQGIFSEERRLDDIAEYIRRKKEQYIFCIMGGDNGERKRLCMNNKDIIYLGYFPSPYHLAITKTADVGVLVYDAKKMKDIANQLNNLFCAPNKIYEFARFGIPMIGNDIPGLKYCLTTNGIGEVCNINSEISIENAFNAINHDYCSYSQNCKNYYEEVNIPQIVESLINSLGKDQANDK